MLSFQHLTFADSVATIRLHPYLQQEDFVEWHEEHKIHVTAYSPLAGTNPTYNPGNPVPLLKNEVITKIAEKRECTPAQVILAWGMGRGTSVIPKTSHLDRVEENYKSIGCVLESKDIKKIDKLHKEYFRYNNPSKSWDVPLYEGLEDSKGNHQRDS